MGEGATFIYSFLFAILAEAMPVDHRSRLPDSRALALVRYD